MRGFQGYPLSSKDTQHIESYPMARCHPFRGFSNRLLASARSRCRSICGFPQSLQASPVAYGLTPARFSFSTMPKEALVKPDFLEPGPLSLSHICQYASPEYASNRVDPRNPDRARPSHFSVSYPNFCTVRLTRAISIKQYNRVPWSLH